MMDSGVVGREGLRVATIGPFRRASRPLDSGQLRSSEASLDGEPPGSSRRRQVLSDDPGHAVARRRDLPPMLLGFDHQERPR